MQLNKSLIAEWKDLQKLKEINKNLKITSLFDNDPYRTDRYQIEFNGLTLDYSRNFLNDDILKALVSYLEKINLSDNIKKLLSGQIINQTEKKPALHCFLRDLNNKEAIENLNYLEEKFKKIQDKINQNKITNIVNIGIGGSHLGPEMLYNSLSSFTDNNIKCHFVSNIDPENIIQILNAIDPKHTIFIVSSKSFSTDETITNYKISRSWLSKYYTSEHDIQDKFYAVTANEANAYNEGFNKNNIILFNNNIGGRYSLTSAIALPFILSSNFENFKKFISGANAIDKHFSSSSFLNNIPVILALIEFWYINFYHINNRAVIPYSYNLRLLPKYLQQLTMESNGKSVDNNQNNILYNTSNIIWGGMGTDVQHSFFQMIHQGTNIIPCDFIIPLKPNDNLKTNFDNGISQIETAHNKLISNAFAQIEVLVSGAKSEEKCKTISGNKPCNVILFDKITPEIMGMLIAIYEQKIFTLGSIWNINCFDQFGVEKGKKLANQILDFGSNDDLNINNLIAMI